jgi:hypothetical protein
MMFGTPTRKLGLATAAVAATLAATIGIAGARAGDGHGNGTISVKGSFAATNFSGPECPSPLGLCAKATFKGGLRGEVIASVTSVAPTAQPGVSLIGADLIFDDPRGELRCTETVVANLTPGSDAEEAFICQFTGGTGKWAGVKGHIEAYGSAPGGQAEGRGRYEGRLVLE